MVPTVARRLLLADAILAVPAVGYAQEAMLTGTVADSTGGVLPGVTITALLEATGTGALLRFRTTMATTDGSTCRGRRGGG